MIGTFTHPYFGMLSNLDSKFGQSVDPDVCWEREFVVDGNPVKASLWIGQSEAFQTARLDAFAALLSDLPVLDVRARSELRSNLTNDPSYIEFHVDELSEIPVISALTRSSQDTAISVEAFVHAMKLTRIGLWHGSEQTPVVLDYMIDPEHSDEILAVKVCLNGDIGDVVWES